LATTATELACGTISLRSSSRFPVISDEMNVEPVILPPGRARDSTSPAPTGSALAGITMGMVVVARRAACTATVGWATRTSTPRRTSSVANPGRRSYRPSADRHSSRTVRPSTRPTSLSPCRSASIQLGAGLPNKTPTRATFPDSVAPGWRAARRAHQPARSAGSGGGSCRDVGADGCAGQPTVGALRWASTFPANRVR
jgi:hypothetical protein